MQCCRSLPKILKYERGGRRRKREGGGREKEEEEEKKEEKGPKEKEKEMKEENGKETEGGGEGKEAETSKALMPSLANWAMYSSLDLELSFEIKKIFFP